LRLKRQALQQRESARQEALKEPGVDGSVHVVRKLRRRRVCEALERSAEEKLACVYSNKLPLPWVESTPIISSTTVTIGKVKEINCALKGRLITDGKEKYDGKDSCDSAGK
jgi:hypothetical protein